MAHATSQGTQLLHGFKRLTRFDKGLGAQLPEAYKKFWREWKLSQPAAVHYIPKEGKWENDEVTGQVKPIQNVPLPLIDTPESHTGIWGGEAVLKGFQKRHPLKRRVPHFWVPTLRRSVVYSKILNEHMSMVVTDRTIEQIHDSFGFDHYLLKNPACDLRSTLALKIKRQILLELQNGCPNYASDPTEQRAVLNEYKCYLDSYTPEEIDWYGHTYNEAIRKLQQIIREQYKVAPHKREFRSKLLQQLRLAGVQEEEPVINENKPSELLEKKAETETDVEALTKLEDRTTKPGTWLSRINPFGSRKSN